MTGESLPHLVVWPQPQLPVAHGAADIVGLLQVLQVALQRTIQTTAVIFLAVRGTIA